MLKIKEKALIKILFLMTLVMAVMLSGNKAFADDEPYIQSIDVESFGYFIKSWPPAIGCDVRNFHTIVHMSDGSIATNDELKQMDWKIEHYDNVNKTYSIVKTGEGETIGFWMPYGTEEGQYKVTATSKIDPDALGYKWEQLRYPSYTETFCICKPGTVKYGEITTNTGDVVTGAKRVEHILGAKDIKETYDWDTKKYTCILPQSPYKSKDYTFAGWKIDGKVYKPGAKFVAGYEDVADHHNAYFEAQWKPNFNAPNVVANKAGKKKIRLSWNRMVGGNGYKIYRAVKKNGKYKRVKTVKNRLTTSWTDKKVKAGKKYYYKVAPFKKGKMKKSAWVLTSTKAAKVKSVKLSKTAVKGKAGKIIKLKAKVRLAKGKKLSNKFRWYTSNKKIAKINQKTGKLKLVNAGTCQVWAKAYNGKNSTKINVTVLAK